MAHASVTSHSRAPYGLLPDCSRAVLNKSRASIHGAHMGLVRRRTNSARRVLMHALYFYGPRTGLDIVNSPWKARKWPVRTPYAQIRRPSGIFANDGCVSKGAVRHSCGSHTGPVRYKNEYPRAGPVRCPYGHRMGYLWSPANYSTNHKYATVSSRTGPVAWCDRGNSTDVKFLRALHLA